MTRSSPPGWLRAGRHQSDAGALIVQVTGEARLDAPFFHTGLASGTGSPALTTAQVQANLEQDTEAASAASGRIRPGIRKTGIEEAALNVAGKGISEEGRDLIGEKDGQGIRIEKSPMRNPLIIKIGAAGVCSKATLMAWRFGSVGPLAGWRGICRLMRVVAVIIVREILDLAQERRFVELLGEGDDVVLVGEVDSFRHAVREVSRGERFSS